MAKKSHVSKNKSVKKSHGTSSKPRFKSKPDISSIKTSHDKSLFLVSFSKVTATKSGVSKQNNKSRQSNKLVSIGLSLQRPTSISSLASVCRFPNSGRFTGNYGPVTNFEDLNNEKLGVFNRYGHNLADTIVLHLLCTFHEKVAITQIPNRGLFLPHADIRSGQSWQNACTSLINRLVPGISIDSKNSHMKDSILIDQLRLQMPVYLDYITRVTYSASLTEEGCKAKLCEDNNRVCWLPLDALSSKTNYLGPEPVLISGDPNKHLEIREITLSSTISNFLDKRITDSMILHATSLMYRETDLIKIYSDFLQHTFPSEYMNLNTLQSYFVKLRYSFRPNVDWTTVFELFNPDKSKNFINFHEFVIGLTALDNYSKVEKSDIKSDLNSSSKKSQKSRPKSCKSLKDRKKSVSKIKLADFVSSSPFEHYVRNSAYPQLDFKKDISDINRDMHRYRLEKLARDSCPKCCRREYSIGQHILTIQQDSTIGQPIVTPPEEIKESKCTNEKLRKHSKLFFCRQFVCNQIMEIIRSYAFKMNLYSIPDPISKNELPKWDSPEDRGRIVEKIFTILHRAKEEYGNQPRALIHVTSPAYVIGDIHGNLHDLLLCEQTLWKLGVHSATTNFLFLGDIVDRGNYSIECALYLICMKLLAPSRVFILRGNHESRAVAREYTFEKECFSKFGDEYGAEMFELFNQVFDLWPLAGVLDDAIFCAHGGIPSGVTRLEQIAAIKLPLPEPDRDTIANEILWNDPLPTDEFRGLAEDAAQQLRDGATMSSINQPVLQSLVANDVDKVASHWIKQGFLFNKKRGTANYFSEVALMKFLEDNGCTHIIRAHEMIPSGYQFMFGGRCITIFSCAKYCDGLNEAAVALVANQKIRIIKIDKNAA